MGTPPQAHVVSPPAMISAGWWPRSTWTSSSLVARRWTRRSGSDGRGLGFFLWGGGKVYHHPPVDSMAGICRRGRDGALGALGEEGFRMVWGLLGSWGAQIWGLLGSRKADLGCFGAGGGGKFRVFCGWGGGNLAYFGARRGRFGVFWVLGEDLGSQICGVLASREEIWGVLGLGGRFGGFQPLLGSRRVILGSVRVYRD